MTVIVQLSGCDTATALGVSIKARGMKGPMGPLARRLLDDGLASPFDEVAVYRGKTLCFHPRALIHWASVQTVETASSSAKTVVYKRRPDFEVSL